MAGKGVASESYCNSHQYEKHLSDILLVVSIHLCPNSGVKISRFPSKVPGIPIPPHCVWTSEGLVMKATTRFAG